MNSSISHKDIFPLEQLFLRLEVAGFKLSPADKIRALRILDGPASASLDKPELLKKLLAPALVRNATEQTKFYDVFDLYFREISQPYNNEVAKKEYRFPSWISWLFLLLAAFLLSFGWLSFWKKDPVPKEPSIHIQGPENTYVGDTLSYLNISKFIEDSTAVKWTWTYGTPGETPELVDSTHSNWFFVVPPLNSNIYQKEVRLQLEYQEKDSIYESSHKLIVLCSAPPAVKRINGPKKLEAGENATFIAAVNPEILDISNNNGRDVINGSARNWLFEWDFGDGTKDEGYYLSQHIFEENGLYNVRLTVTDTSLIGYCTTSHILEVKVGEEKAFIPLTTLHKDRLKPIAVWAWAYYVLLALFGIGIIYHWGRWLIKNKKAKQKGTAETPEQKTLKARFEINDKAPYIIPLRNQNQQIQPSAEHLQFADALRLRQTGLRKEIDVAATLDSTINSGGYPSVKFRYATQASEYLFLIDEQCRASHLGRLFKYLAENLRGQDVLMEVFHYRLHFNRFWNHYHTAGISLDQLQKEYPNYRLVVLGDLHELIDPYAKNHLKLRLEQANLLKQWQQRLLLSPVPPVSWTYREKLLARVFNIFPADIDGIANAALHLENGSNVSINDQGFDQWKEAQIAQRHDNDTEYRQWKRWRHIKDYLSAYDPDLSRWFKALAVFPMHSWEMTIAIGRALGIQITYDKLLQLARIPSLQKDRFNERLRQELLSVLDKADETLARRAVKRELNAVKAISTGSAVSRDLEASLAIQSFALDPDAQENQDTVRFLLEKGILSPAQEKELDWVSSKHVQSSSQVANSVNTKKPSISTREWLNADNYVAEHATKKNSLFNKDFWTALLLSLAYATMLVLGLKWDGSDSLYKTVFWEQPESRVISAKEPLRNYYFVKEELVVDSAIIFNNIGVDRSGLAEKQDTSTAHYFYKAMEEASPVLKGGRENFVDKDVSYLLANANLAKLYFNTGVNFLNQYLNDSLGQSVLTEALGLLEKAYINDSIALDVIHAMGVIHYYKGSPEDSIQNYYQRLDSLSYFDSLNYSPNLETLLDQKNSSRITNVSIDKPGNQQLNVSVDYFLNTGIIPSAYVRITPIGEGKQPDAQTNTLDGGIGTLSFTFSPPSRSKGTLSSFLIEFHRRPSNDVIDSKSIAFNHNWYQIKKSRDNTIKPPFTEQSPLKVLDFQIRGQVVDGLSRKGLSGVNVVLKEKATSSSLNEPLRLVNATDQYGTFSFEGKFNGGLKTSITVVLSKVGYKEFTVYSTAEELMNLSSKNTWVMRLENTISRPKMEYINGGTFKRTDATDNYSKKEPTVQSVEVDDFQISSYEVTFSEYDLFCEMTARERADDNGWGRKQRPVSNVSWLDAIEYCNWLSRQHNFIPAYTLRPSKTGMNVDINLSANGYRLPTEAEWEYAAMGGIKGDKNLIYAGGSDIDEVAWYDNNSNNQAHLVGQKRPNNAGLYDMSGNVWEWCQDWYAPYPSYAEKNPIGSNFGSHRIIRGGAWIQQAGDCRVDFRRENNPKEKHSWLGFRLVRGAKQY